MVFQPNSMFKETFDQGILEATMTGHVDFWLRNVLSRDVQIIAFSIFGPCCDDVIASALALQVGELWRQNSNLKRERTHFEGRGVDLSCEANF